MFDGLRAALAERLPLEGAGFIVADSSAYARWLVARPGFEGEGHSVLKEWEVTAAKSGVPDIEKLRRYEQEIGGKPGLFGAIVADRRLFMGRDCTYSQDYRRRFTDSELLCILQCGLERTEELFNVLRPDVVFSFICVTMLDYLAYLFARSRGIRFLNLRPTRVGDRVTFGSILNDPSPDFAASFTRIQAAGQSPFLGEAREYIKRVREQHGRYEGVVRPSDRPALAPNKTRLLGGVVRTLRNYVEYRRSMSASDNHVPDPLRAMVFTALVNPYRAQRARKFLRQHYISPEALAGTRFVFFPLHTEPEVSLLVYGRPYVNQIEIIRMLAMSLPVDFVLVVKEHPWMVGKRSISAYRKMLNIPRVRFADPRMEARSLIQSSQMVAVVTGSVALEAAMLGKPVVTFGDCPYNLLPATMVRRIDDPRSLANILRTVLHEYASNDRALEAYVAAVFETSCGVNLYSVLLGKKNVHVERSGAYDGELAKLADHVVRLLDLPDSTAVASNYPDLAASW